MNRIRRKAINEIFAKLEELKDELEILQEEEQMAYDNLPESIQESERGQQMERYVDRLADAISDLENAIDNLDLEEV